MPWVPLATSGLSYQFMTSDPETGEDVPGLPENVTFNAGTSILALAPPEPTNSNADWTLVFPDVPSARVRVTISEFVGANSGELEYSAAYFSWIDEEIYPQVVENEAEFESGFVNEFLPSPLEFAAFMDPDPERGRPAFVFYGPSSYYDDGHFVGLDRSWSMLIEAWVDGPEPPSGVSYNCECDDPNPSRTLAELRNELLIRLGFAAMVDNPPPGMPALLDSFLQGAQRSLYRQYTVLRTERFYTWELVPGVRFYDLDANADVCTKKLDPRMITWAGISDGDDCWRPLICGIPPECYQSATEQGIPYRYEIRQCIELWPAPDSADWKLRIKGHFGLEPFAEDGDQCTIDDEAVFLFALARAKAHYGQPDAANYQQDALNYMRNVVAGKHQTRRYIPGEPVVEPLPKPLWIPKVYP